jgi:hypothetical protein
MAMTLARPEGNPAGSDGLALFYVELRDDTGALRQIRVNRLKEKLGTRMVPTAELSLEGVPATPVAGLSGGVKHIAPMLYVTRTWNAVMACASMRRGLALARDYASKRVAFGGKLADKPLHRETLAALEAEFEGALALAFRVVELLGRDESGDATDADRALSRVLTPLAKLTTAKQAVAVASEVLEAFGGAGYVEDTGIPRLLRDAQVFPVWEGTTNVLALDAVRVLAKGSSMALLERDIERCLASGAPDCAGPAEAVRRAMAHARAWWTGAAARGPAALEAGARHFAMTLGRAAELALLVEHAAWAAAHGDRSSAAAARQFARNGVDWIRDDDPLADAQLLLGA